MSVYMGSVKIQHVVYGFWAVRRVVEAFRDGPSTLLSSGFFDTCNCVVGAGSAFLGHEAQHSGQLGLQHCSSWFGPPPK